jgi:hypothetical protein
MPLAQPRPSDLEDFPLLVNPPRFAPSPELARIIGKLSSTGNPEEAWLEYDRRIDAFRETNKARELWREPEVCDKIATGTTREEYELLNDAYFVWRDSFIDHAALARRESARAYQALGGPQICGGCGGSFPSIGALLSHESFCSFRRGSATVSDLGIQGL